MNPLLPSYLFEQAVIKFRGLKTRKLDSVLPKGPKEQTIRDNPPVKAKPSPDTTGRTKATNNRDRDGNYDSRNGAKRYPFRSI